MKVNPSQLEAGCILANDVTSISSQPLMRKKTVITDELIDVLEAFLIHEVEVESKLVNGKIYNPKKILIENKIDYPTEIKKETNIELYHKSVEMYKKLFSGWQAGKKIDIVLVRKLAIPLYEKFSDNKADLISILKLTDEIDYINHHAVSVCIISSFIGNKLGLSKPEGIQLAIASLLADCGMSKILTSTLNKKGDLTKTEFDEIKKHSMYSYQMLKDLPGISEAILLAVLQHHERNDGSGYPLKLNQEKIHRFAKVITVVDVFHALVSNRPYREKKTLYRAIEILLYENFGQFEHNILQILIDTVIDVSIGKTVKLNNGDQGEVIFIEQNEPTRPMIRLNNGEFLKLTQKKDIFIEDVLD